MHVASIDSTRLLRKIETGLSIEEVSVPIHQPGYSDYRRCLQVTLLPFTPAVSMWCPNLWGFKRKFLTEFEDMHGMLVLVFHGID